MTGDRSRLRNFVKKFIGTVRFGNDHFGVIMGYGDYVFGDSVISKTKAMSGLLRDLIFLILQFLREENYKEAAHRLESESGVFFDVNYIEELVIKGDWDNLEKYLAGFICVGDNRYSVKMLFEIRKQKYLEALDKNEGAKAFEILNEELKVFKPDGELFSEMANLFMLENIRENAQLSTYTDDVTARGVLASELKKLIEKNPELCHKCQLPTVNNSRLRLLVNQSLNWQHQLCQNPNSVPDITSILVDHLCGPQNAAQGQVHVANEFNSIRRSGGLQLPPTSNVASSLPPGAILALPASTSRTNVASQVRRKRPSNNHK